VYVNCKLEFWLIGNVKRRDGSISGHSSVGGYPTRKHAAHSLGIAD
jgi:hypothetical protein